MDDEVRLIELLAFAGMRGVLPALWILDQVQNDDAYAPVPPPCGFPIPLGMTGTTTQHLWIADQVRNDEFRYPLIST